MTDTVQMTLTPQEVAIIEARRTAQALDRAVDTLGLVLLKVAFNYKAWLLEHGRGSSFSTFCDEFGGSPVAKNRKTDYEAIQKIRILAQQLARATLQRGEDA